MRCFVIVLQYISSPSVSSLPTSFHIPSLLLLIHVKKDCSVLGRAAPHVALLHGSLSRAVLSYSVLLYGTLRCTVLSGNVAYCTCARA